MKLTVIPALIGLGAALLGSQASAQSKSDVAKLHELVQEARAQVKVLRTAAGIGGEAREGEGEHGGERREGRGEHGEGRERREGRGEHGGERREGHGEHGEGGEGEEGGKRVAKNEKWDAVRNGARLVIAYDAASQSFKGVVTNASERTLEDVRVEVHLSNGIELGPTKRTNIEAGKNMEVELSAAGQEFEWWTTHPEHGSEEGHAAEGEEGEESEEGGDRPTSAALRPLYNELLLLNREIRMLTEGLMRRAGGERRERR